MIIMINGDSNGNDLLGLFCHGNIFISVMAEERGDEDEWKDKDKVGIEKGDREKKVLNRMRNAEVGGRKEKEKRQNKEEYV